MGGFAFVSYSHTDKAYATRLAAHLAENGITCWIDHQLDYGAQWPRVIERQIDACAAFIVIMTEQANDSTWVRNELEHARRRRKPILPLRLSGDVFFGLYDAHYVDVRGGGLPGRQFVDQVRGLTTPPAASVAPPAPAPGPSPVKTPSSAVGPDEAGERAPVKAPSSAAGSASARAAASLPATASPPAVARAAGVAARAPRRVRRDDQERRRTGAGIPLFLAALALAAMVWFGQVGPVGAAMTSLLRSTFGSIALAFPVILLVEAVRRWRGAAGRDARARAVVGWSALTVGAAGVLQLAAGNPSGSHAVARAGGRVGRGSGLLAEALTAATVVPMLGMVLLFGLLVITATPIVKVPGRLARLWSWVIGRPVVRTPTVDPDDVHRRPAPTTNDAPSWPAILLLAHGAPPKAHSDADDKIAVIPRPDPETVALGDVLRSRAAAVDRHPLVIGLGQDVEGGFVAANLARLPNLLIAGTGSTLDALVISLLTRASPATMRLLLIDPRRESMAAYADLPHLVTPIVTKPRKAVAALRWAVREMEMRRDDFAANGVPDIDDFNRKVQRGEITAPAGSAAVLRPCPYVVVVVAELADLMAVAAREVEESIVRIAARARETGIHLVLAAGDPGVEVLTGRIKAAMPSRLTFAAPGEEGLLGNGDGLFLPLGAPSPTRIQAPEVDAREIEAVVRFWTSRGAPAYVDGVTSYKKTAGPA